jgi:drug/metabolite transporter (DMT)-like permease
MLFSAIASKLLAESLLSLYPVFVKTINLSFGLQLWSRFFTYVAISFIFVDMGFIYKHLFSKNGFLLSLITVLHVYFSYRGFQLLESGVAFVLFYTYPIFILLFAGKPLPVSILLSLVGVYLLASSRSSEAFGIVGLDDVCEEMDDAQSSETVFKTKEESQKKEAFPYEGVLMVLLASVTEAMIYFLVRSIKTDNHWNHMFLSYGLGSLLFSGLFFKDVVNTNITSVLSISMVINLVIGLFGYLLRFYAIRNLDTVIYSPLSYFGVIMAYVYGVLFQQEVITWQKILGSVFILVPNFFVFI